MEILSTLELNRIYQMDCLDGMRLLPDKSVSLICIDPPYNIGKDKWDKWKTVNDYVQFMGSVFIECERILKDNGSFYFFHNDFLQVVELQNWLNNQSKLNFNQLIIWNKRFNEARNKGFLDGFIVVDGLRNYQQMAEYCLFYTKHSELGITTAEYEENNYPTIRKYFKELQEAIGLSLSKINKTLGHRKAEHAFYWKTSQWGMPTYETYQEIIKLVKDESFEVRTHDDLVDEFEKTRYTYNNLKTHHSVWNYEIAKKQGHITPKPVDLIENIILHSSYEDDLVLDCFMGSGTTAVAALKNNRKFIGFEKESKYIEIANKRLINLELK